MDVVVYDHPLSPYAQKVKIALDEKGVAYEARLPEGIGSGRAAGDFAAASPRGEVPALVHGDVRLFDSSVILHYLEERWPEPPLLPDAPAERARVRMLEDVMDTHYEANTWGVAEVRAFGRASGEKARAMEAEAERRLGRWHRWLEARLGEAEWMNGAAFGWGDLCAAPFVNGAAGFGYGPPAGSRLAAWHARVSQRPSVARAARAAREAASGGAGGGLEAVREALEKGLFKREYRDHRLEWMVKVGAIDVVEAGLERRNIRFVDEFAE